jgi:hypothetical protein
MRGKILGGGADEDSLSIGMWGVWADRWEFSVGICDASKWMIGRGCGGMLWYK